MLMLIIVSSVHIAGYNQTMYDIRYDYNVITEGMDENEYYIIVDGDNLFDYYTYYFKNENTNANLLVGVLNSNNILYAMKIFNTMYEQINENTWLDTTYRILVTLIIDEDISHVYYKKIKQLEY
jgi:hypothetical protein